MEAIVLAGGLGTRLRAVVPHVPKPMAPIAGRPFLALLLERLIQQGVTSIILSLHFRAECVRDCFGDVYLDTPIQYSVDNKPLGTGGAARLAMQLVTEDHVYILNGDTYHECHLLQLEQLWQATHEPIIVAQKILDTARYGRLTIQNGRVVGFSEKGQHGMGFINAGCYVFNATQLSEWPLHLCFSLEKDYLPSAISLSRFNAFITDGEFIDIGVPEDYALAQTQLIRQSNLINTTES